MNKLYLTLALVLTVVACQPAQAEQAVGQMIDDSGLVISSYADGSIKEFTLSKSDMASPKVFQHSKQVSSVVLQNSDLAEVASK